MLMIVAAGLETLGIGMIVPFVGIITNPNMIQEQASLHYIFNLLNFQTTTAFIIFSVVLLLVIFVGKNIYLLFFNYAQFRLILNQQVKLSSTLFKSYLTKPYAFHLQRNTSELLRNINGEVANVFQGIIMASFQLITEILVILCILCLLVITAPIATIVASVLLAVSVIIFFTFLRKKISALGKEQQRVGATTIKWVNQGLGASKEVKVSGKENFFIKSYTAQNQIRANNSRFMKMLEVAPRVFIETILVFIILITMLIIVFQGNSMTQLVSTMALFAMAAFRLMPSITRVVSLITTIRYNQPALSVIYDDLFSDGKKHSKDISNRAIDGVINTGERLFNDSIQLKNVSFRYPEQIHHALRDINLTIPIGKSVAFIGESGAGKTTLVDLILGLFEPEYGDVYVDGKKLKDQKKLWQQKIGYIPQSIFLSDDSIRANVAFGIDSELVDDTEVWRALEQAQLKSFVQALPDQLNTSVGENGVRISGGQRQRIGIARALYHNPEILFMDEATSALDNETEKEIMKAIDGLKGDKTLIIIAHRLSTIKNCDIVFELSHGKITSIHNENERSVIQAIN